MATTSTGHIFIWIQFPWRWYHLDEISIEIVSLEYVYHEDCSQDMLSIESINWMWSPWKLKHLDAIPMTTVSSADCNHGDCIISMHELQKPSYEYMLSRTSTKKIGKLRYQGYLLYTLYNTSTMEDSSNYIMIILQWVRHLFKATLLWMANCLGNCGIKV